MEAITSTSRMFNVVSGIKCVIPFVISLVELWNLLYVVLTQNCVFVLIMSVTSKYFRSHFLNLFLMESVKHCVHKWWRWYVIKYVLCP